MPKLAGRSVAWSFKDRGVVSYKPRGVDFILRNFPYYCQLFEEKNGLPLDLKWLESRLSYDKRKEASRGTRRTHATYSGLAAHYVVSQYPRGLAEVQADIDALPEGCITEHIYILQGVSKLTEKTRIKIGQSGDPLSRLHSRNYEHRKVGTGYTFSIEDVYPIRDGDLIDQIEQRALECAAYLGGRTVEIMGVNSREEFEELSPTQAARAVCKALKEYNQPW